MADSVGTLKTNVTANAAGFVAGIGQAAAAAAGGTSKIKASFAALGGLGGKLGISAGGMGLEGLMGGITSPGMMGLGAVGGIYTTIQGFAGKAKEMIRDSAKMGTTVEQYQQLARVGRQSGISIEETTGGLRKMRMAIYGANQGNKELANTFQSLGLNSRKLMRMNAGDQMEAIAKGLARITNQTERQGLETKIFGRTGAALDPMLLNIAGGGLAKHRRWYDMDASSAQAMAEQKQGWTKELPDAAAGIFAGAAAGWKILGAYLGDKFAGGSSTLADEAKQLDTAARMQQERGRGGAPAADTGLHAFAGLAMAGSQEAYQSTIAWQRGLQEKQTELLQELVNQGRAGMPDAQEPVA